MPSDFDSYPAYARRCSGAVATARNIAVPSAPYEGLISSPERPRSCALPRSLPRHFDFATFQVVSLFDVFHGKFVRRDEA